MKKSIVFPLLLTFIGLSTSLLGQQNLVYNHYFSNPYLYNPSFIAPEGYTKLFLNYRQQWSGFEGAPTTITANLQIPINYKMGIAVNAYNDKAGVIETTTGLVSFAYQVYLGKRVEQIHKIGFGLSVGYSNSRVDLAEVDNPNDPALLNGTTSGLDGQFGIHYQNNRFKLGFSIPRIFKTYIASDEDFNNPGIEQIKNTITSVSYNFPIGQKLSFEPYFTYRTAKDLPSRYEVLGIMRMDDLFWAGGGYRQDYGAIAMLGISLKNKITVGYAYEFATSQVDGFGNGTHEFQLGIRLGKKKKTRSEVVEDFEPEDEPIEDEPIQEEPVQEEQVKEEIKEEVTPPVVVPTPIPTPIKEEVQPEIVQEEPEPQPTYYVIVGVFSSQRNADEFMKELIRAGYTANIGEYPANNYHFVYIGQPYSNLEDAKVRRDEIRAINRFTFKEAWILPLE